MKPTSARTSASKPAKKSPAKSKASASTPKKTAAKASSPATARKATAKKPATKASVKKATTSKPAATKTVAKKAAAKPPKKAAAKPAKKAVAKKVAKPVRKATVKKTAVKKATVSKAKKASKPAARKVTKVAKKPAAARKPAARKPVASAAIEADEDEAPISGVSAVRGSQDDEDDEDDEVPAGAPAIGTDELVALLRPGARLTCEMSDFDVQDTYVLTITQVNPGLSFSYIDRAAAAGEDVIAAQTGEVTVSEQALETATEVILISQGTVEDSPEQTPPFLLARTLLASLKEGEPIGVKVYGGQNTLQLDGTRTAKLKVNGEERSVTVLRAEDEDTGVALDVLDHPTWPLLLRFDDGDDVGIWLTAIDAR